MSLNSSAVRGTTPRGAPARTRDALALLVAEANRLKAMPASDRPNEASMSDVRSAFADSMEQLLVHGPQEYVTVTALLEAN